MENSNFIIDNGILKKYVGSEEKVIIPDSVIKIGERAFENSSVKEVSFSGKNLRSIEGYAFNLCQELHHLQIPDGVIQIGDHAFSNCSELHYISLPDSLVDVGEEILVGCHYELFVIGSKGSEAESVANAHGKPLRTDGAKAIKAYELLQSARENSEVRDFEIFGEDVACDGQLKTYDEIISYYRNQKDSFFNEVLRRMPTSIQKGYNGFPEKVFEGANQTLYSRMEKFGLIVNQNDITHYILTPYATFFEIIKSISEVHKTLVDAVKNNIEINNQALINTAESKVTGLSYGVIGDSFDMLFYSIDDYREKQKQRKAAYAEAQQEANRYLNSQTREGDRLFADFLAKVQPHLRQACDAYMEGLRQAEVALLLKNNILTSDPEEDYDIKKSVQIMQKVFEREGDNRFSIALALKKYPCNVAALIYAVEHDYTCPDLTAMMDYLKLSDQVYAEVNRRKEQKKKEIISNIDSKVASAAVELIQSNLELFNDDEIRKILVNLSIRIAKPLQSLFHVEKVVETSTPENYVRQNLNLNLPQSLWELFDKYGVSPVHPSAEIPEEYASSRAVLLSQLTEAFKAGNESCKAAEEAARLEQERLEAIRLQEEEARRKQNKKNAIIALTSIAAVILFFVLLTDVIIPHIKYGNAIDLMESGKYAEAISVFEELDGFKNSRTKINECHTAILNRQYDQAIALMEAGKYQEAIDAFEELYGYRDSNSKIKECNDAILNEKYDEKYDNAIALMEAGKYTEAISVFKEINGHKDSSELIKEAKYNIALGYYNEKNFDAANPIFESISDYKDSKEKIHYHKYSVVKDSPATCTSDGIKVTTCSCGDTNTETQKAYGHNYSAATCTKGSTCSRCGSVTSGALGHTTSTGVCSRCNYNFTKPLVFTGNEKTMTNQEVTGINLPQGKYSITVEAKDGFVDGEWYDFGVVILWPSEGLDDTLPGYVVIQSYEFTSPSYTEIFTGSCTNGHLTIRCDNKWKVTIKPVN